MNCQECRSLVERFLDHALTGFTKRKVNLHLSRCADCRAYFDRRRENQALAYRALNAALADTHLPEGFAERFRAAHVVPERRFRLFWTRRTWKAVASLAALASFFGFAAVVVTGRLTSALDDAKVSYPQSDEVTTTESDIEPLSIDSGGQGTVLSATASGDNTSDEQPNQPKGGENMTIRKPAMAAMSVALAAAPLATVADGGGYTSASYVQDGLIAQWDGIDNNGTGTHNPLSAIWKDLKGSCDMTLLNNGESWVNGNALSVYGRGAAGTNAAPRYTTIEVVYKMTSGACMFVSGLKWGNTEWYISRFVAFSGDRALFTNAHAESGTKTIYIPGANGPSVVHSLSAVFADNNSDTVISASMDGFVRTANTVSSGWYDASGVVMVGDRKTGGSNESWTGEIYAIRLYDRALSVGELAANQKVDEARFGVSGWYSCISSGNPIAAAVANSYAAAEATPLAAIEARGFTREWSDGIALDAMERHFGTVFRFR